jgi:flagellar operon protein
MLRVRQGLVPGTPVPAGGELRFSAHAQTRIQSRQIALEPSHLDRLQGAVQRAASKGARDALVLMDDLAMVVSVTNRTVVTVVDKDNLKQNVFTNIDSAVIA